jgi:hypothetical protein
MSGFSLPPGDHLEVDIFSGYLRDADLRKFRVGSKFIVLSRGLSREPLVGLGVVKEVLDPKRYT